MIKTISSILLGFSIFSCAQNETTQNNNVSLFNKHLDNSNSSVNDRYALETEWNKHYNEALRLDAAGEREKAIEEMKKAIAIKPKYRDSYGWIAKWYDTLGQIENMANTYRQIIELFPEDLIAHNSLAKILIRNLKQYDEGLKEAKLSKELSSKEMSYVLDKLVGEAYKGLGDKESAIKHYKLFLKGLYHDPDSGDYKDVKKKVLELEKQSNEEIKQSP
jgi:tetratricopeptide (TPR) repeat protein